jgi:hypothetical protein
MASKIGNSTCDQLEAETSIQGASDYWKQCRQCHPVFFKHTSQMLKELDLPGWYESLLPTIFDKFQNDPGHFENNSEAGMVAMLLSGETGFECNVISGGCDRMPTCKSIVEHLEQRHPEWSPQQLMEESRKSNIVLETIVALSKAHNAIYVSTSSAFHGCTVYN